MKITMKNKDLAKAINFLNSLNLKGKDSRSRSKFIRLLEKYFEELKDDELELLREFDLLDENGNIKQDTSDTDSIRLFNIEQEKLYSEQVVINCEDIIDRMNTLKEVLENLDTELSGDDAYIYDYLLDEIEK